MLRDQGAAYDFGPDCAPRLPWTGTLSHTLDPPLSSAPGRPPCRHIRA